MSAAGSRGMSLRRWLALALAIVVIVPVVVTAIVAFAVVRLPQAYRFEAGQRIRDDVAEWNNPAWQAETSARYADRGIDFALYEDGQEIYRSTPDPLTAAHGGRTVQRYRLEGAPAREVLIYSNLSPTGQRRFALIPLVGFSLVLATIGGVAWFIGRTVVRPLAATSAAARQVASGDLDVQLPASAVREVRDVNTAFEGMSATLRAALRRQEELEQSRRLFIGAIAHDLRTPLFILRGSLEGIATGVADTAEKRERYIAIAREKADALERLIGDLFDYSRLEYLEQAPSRERLDLADLLRRLVDANQPGAEEKGITLTLDASSLPLDADPHLLNRAIENLLDNAVHFTPHGGSVLVRCRPTSNGASITIRDSGPGIPPADLPHIFSPLYRGEASRNRRTGGAGLGLATAQRIFLAHGGDLRADNAPDGGAVFTGTLPM